MDDSIGRQDIIDMAYGCEDEFGKDVVFRFVDYIRQLPSAKPEQQWIPCSERLPDTNRDVLLQFKTNMGVGFWENGEWGVNTGDNIYSEIGEGEAKPIAWMPLPEPYKGET